MKKVLVTGSKGQLGQEFRSLVGDNSNYIFTTRKEFDINDCIMMDNYLKEHPVDIIINCASYTNTRFAETEEGYKNAKLININGVENLALIANKYNIFVIHFGTDYMYKYGYNTCNLNPINEDLINFNIKDNTLFENLFVNELQNNYAKTKLFGCKKLYDIMENKNFLIIVISWLYSEFGKNFIKTIINKIKNNEMCDVVANEYGSPTYAQDLAKFVIDIIETDSYKIENNIINFSGLGVASWYDLSEESQFIYNNITGNYKNFIKPLYKKNFKDINRPPFSQLNLAKLISLFGEKEYIRHWRDSLTECLVNLNKINPL